MGSKQSKGESSKSGKDQILAIDPDWKVPQETVDRKHSKGKRSEDQIQAIRWHWGPTEVRQADGTGILIF
jgi:hypothetical protein